MTEFVTVDVPFVSLCDSIVVVVELSTTVAANSSSHGSGRPSASVSQESGLRPPPSTQSVKSADVWSAAPKIQVSSMPSGMPSPSVSVAHGSVGQILFFHSGCAFLIVAQSS